jgi:hypothetical protein
MSRQLSLHISDIELMNTSARCEGLSVSFCVRLQEGPWRKCLPRSENL